MRIAVVQFKLRMYNDENNFHLMKSYIQKAALAKADLIVFPEYCLSGPKFNEKVVRKAPEYIRRFKQLAKKYAINIIPGSIPEVPKKEFNAAYYISSEGKIVSKYRKINLYRNERLDTVPGRKVKTFETKHGKTSVIICWDITSDKILRGIKEQKAEIIICPSYWDESDTREVLDHKRYYLGNFKKSEDSERAVINGLCKKRAIENKATLVY